MTPLGIARAALAGLTFAMAGCTVTLIDDEAPESERNACESNGDCAEGLCVGGVCAAASGAIDTVLLEVTPPATETGIGGVRYVERVNGFSENATGQTLNLHTLTTVRGYVTGECDSGNGTVPVRATFTPRERILGLPALVRRATAVRRSVPANDACFSSREGQQIYEFSLAVPQGRYDVYVEPDDSESECQRIPQLFREKDVPQGAAFCLPLTARTNTVSFCINWPSDLASTLEGWNLDIVHPNGGEVLSNRVAIGAPADGPCEGTTEGAGTVHYVADVIRSEVQGDDFAPAEDHLLRLSPPSDTVAPTMHLVVGALPTNADGQRVLPDLEPPFPQKIRLESWVWHRSEIENGIDAPAAATVTLTSRELDGIVDGVPASFSTVIEVDEDGVLAGEVVPGRYRVRAVPRAGSGLAVLEDELAVQCQRNALQPERCAPPSPGAPIETQAGHALFLHPAARIAGTLTSPLGRGLLAGATIQVLPGSTRKRRCTETPIDGGAACEGPFPALDRELGTEAFIPRVASATADSRARFTLTDVDCGGCVRGSGAVFDLVVRPEGASAMPWYVQTGLEVVDSFDRGAVTVPLPVVQSGVVQVPQANPLLVAGALIRAYMFVDDHGQYVADPDSLEPCGSRYVLAENRCLRSVVQIAETRAREDGSYTLLLPSRVE